MCNAVNIVIIGTLLPSFSPLILHKRASMHCFNGKKILYEIGTFLLDYIIQSVQKRDIAFPIFHFFFRFPINRCR